jgi:multiple sugar transport system ATP-binding protein
MRTEISKLHKQLGATMIYVTHDQTEAMTMGDRIVIMKDGIINQVDTPLNLYNKPVNQFVAGFIGSPAMNFLSGTILEKNGLMFESNNSEFKFHLKSEQKDYLKDYVGKEIIIGIRPEDISIENTNGKSIELESELNVIEPMGNETFIYFEIERTQFIARIKPLQDLKVGEKIKLYIDPLVFYLFERKNGENINL